ncbi:GMC family oxidoreductase N-terminal domain-containing protein [Sphingobium sp. HBC34]|uniref:GMC family oxidoreductase N-terminal domain-containing protein n=1 Tax=Sphingobium cyanobacteriorum TaxID=3063954 RepID=A0ABT8ZQ58_9SPHN|nr:GMC family oxidoreductase N-terminal domain-containing protein [Sphingobium sp. HBC34]MDO7836332.1 GMC family oxidoreductase N-terminal domain-containing protein [Sphingobium sp. HBC34]
MSDGAYDYIVVGGGSAGCVIAARLTEDPSIRVLLLEAGPRDTNPWIHIPLGYGKLFKHRKLNWLYETAPEPNLNNRRIGQPRGKVLGGSSSINGLIYIRGQREDFDEWARVGNHGWGYDDLLPYFIRSEDQQRGADPWHGVGGPQAVSDATEPHILCDAFLDAAQEAGYPYNPDFNGAKQEGVGYYQTTSRHGRRVSTAVAYLRPARGRSNLTIMTGALVRRVLFTGTRANGVKWSDARGTHSATARREVILSAGAFGSPHLLQLSGVGDGAHLQSLGIPVVHHNAQVGANLQDHLQVRTVYKAKGRLTFNDDMASLFRMAGVGMRYALTRKGPLTVSAGYAGGFLRSSQAVDMRPDMQLLFITFSTTKMGDKLHPFSAFTTSACPLRPESRGHVRALSPDPAMAPDIFVNFLGTEKDRRDVVAGLRMIRAIVGQPALSRHVESEYLPGVGIADDASLLAYARETAGSIYHPSCTAAMGKVVDGALRVMGVDGLRVADASVMPAVVSGNTNAVAIVIGEKAADLIRSGH